MNPRILDALSNATSLELYQLGHAVHALLADPQRILEIRQHLHLGARVMFYDDRQRQMSAGIVLEFRPKEVVVQEDSTRSKWRLSYAAVAAHPSERSSEIPVAKPIVPTPTFQIGDTVGFTDKYLREQHGIVVRINDKTLSVDCNGQRWRVSPKLLRKIIDLEAC